MAKNCEEFEKILENIWDELKSDVRDKESLSSFIGTCAGVPVNENEMIKDVEKGLKSYERDNMKDFCSLAGIVKRSKLSNSCIVPLDNIQLSGFKLLSSTQEIIGKENALKVAIGSTAVDKTGKAEKRQTSKQKQPKLILSFKKTENNVWAQKEKPQKIVPIYSERLSGQPDQTPYTFK